MSSSPLIKEPFKSVFVAVTKYFDDPDNDGRLDVTEIGKLKDFNLNLGIVRAGLTWLVDQGFLAQVTYSRNPASEHVSSAYELTQEGALHVYELILQAEGKAASGGDDAYEPLPVERGQNFEDVLEKTEKLAELVRSNNGLSSEFRTSIYSSLHFGIALVRASNPTREQVEAVFLRPIRAVLAKLAGGIVGEAAKQLLPLIERLFS